MRRLAAIVPVLVVLAACTTSTNGGPASSVPGSPSASGPPPVVDGFPTGGAPLLALLAKGAAAVHSSHFEQKIAAGSTTSSGPGDQLYRNGKLVEFRQSATYSNHQTIAIRLVGSTAWAQLPDSMLKTAKPWTLLRSDSHNKLVRFFTAALPGSTDPPAPTTASTLAKASDSITFAGVTTVGATKVEHLKLAVNVADAAATYRPAAALQGAGVTTLPTEIWIDHEGRTRRIAQAVTAQGATTRSDTVLSRFNERVVIKAPPKSQVGRI